MIDDLELARTLLERHLANREQLRQARQLQLTEGTSLYLALIEHEIVQESTLVELVASMLNLPYISLAQREIEPRTQKLVPLSMCRTHGVLPLELREDRNGELLLLAMKDPLDIMAMDEISTHVNVGIQPILCGPRDLERALDANQQKAASPLSFDIPRNNSVDFGAFSHTPSKEEESGAGEDDIEDDDSGSLETEDSWAVFFDDALNAPEPSSSMEMRDRASTMALDLMDIDEILEDEEVQSHSGSDDDDDDPLSLLDVPGAASSAHDDANLQGWDVDSFIGKPPPPPIPGAAAPPRIPEPSAASMPEEQVEPEGGAAEPREEEEEEVSEPVASQDAFDALYASIEAEEAPSIPAGTFIAAPSLSVTGELDLDSIREGLAEADSRDDESPASEGSPARSADPIDGGGFPESSVVLDEVEISDEAGSQTHMGGIGQMLSASHDMFSSRQSDSPFSLNEDRRTLTTLGTPKRLNADGKQRPTLVIQEADDENLFEDAIAHVDAAESGQHPVVNEEASQGAPSSVEKKSSEEAAAPSQDVPAPAAALGRLKLKRIAVPTGSTLLDGPVIEKPRSRPAREAKVSNTPEQKSEEEVQEASKLTVQAEVESTLTREQHVKDILDDDDILAGFAAALEEEEEDELLVDDPVRQDEEATPEAREIAQEEVPQEEDVSVRQTREGEPVYQRGGMDATREFDAASIFSFTGDNEDGLDEATSAAMGEAHARIERLNSMIRSANKNARVHSELGAQGTDGLVDESAERARTATTANTALTRDALDKMHHSTMDLSSELLFHGGNSPGLPAEVDDSRLLRAALLILISQDLIKIDELIALAKSLPESS